MLSCWLALGAKSAEHAQANIMHQDLQTWAQLSIMLLVNTLLNTNQGAVWSPRAEIPGVGKKNNLRALRHTENSIVMPQSSPNSFTSFCCLYKWCVLYVRGLRECVWGRLWWETHVRLQGVVGRGIRTFLHSRMTLKRSSFSTSFERFFALHWCVYQSDSEGILGNVCG